MKALFWIVLCAVLGPVRVAASIEILDTREVPLVHIYLVPWELDVNRPLEADDVRSSPWIKMEIVEPGLAHAFVLKIRERTMSESDVPDVVDARVVIELVKDGKVTERLVATYNRLISADGTKAAIIDESFRNQFRVVESKD